MELPFLTITEASTLLSRREITAADLTEACFRQIERLDPVLNAFITVLASEEVISDQSSVTDCYGVFHWH